MTTKTEIPWVVVNLDAEKIPGTKGIFHVMNEAESDELAALLTGRGCHAYQYPDGYYPEDLFSN